MLPRLHPHLSHLLPPFELPDAGKGQGGKKIIKEKKELKYHYCCTVVLDVAWVRGWGCWRGEGCAWVLLPGHQGGDVIPPGTSPGTCRQRQRSGGSSNPLPKPQAAPRGVKNEKKNPHAMFPLAVRGGFVRIGDTPAFREQLQVDYVPLERYSPSPSMNILKKNKQTRFMQPYVISKMLLSPHLWPMQHGY